ncbi:energy-coupling factor ABC transporter ATP-binding protein [Planctomycetota bacterium]
MAAAIQIRNYAYHYPDGTPALHDVNLTITSGEKVVLVGPNGAGKSTLLLALAGFVKGTGSVTIDGLEHIKANLPQIRTRLGCCLENPDDQLFMPRLRDDIAFGPLNQRLSPMDVEKRVQQALETVDLAYVANKPPHHLSAGQKRRAAIATILSMDPAIITFDEPDGSLDPRNRRRLEDLLKSLPQTLIVATCNMRFAHTVADRAVLIDNGTVIADGPVEEILTDTELMENHGLETV